MLDRRTLERRQAEEWSAILCADESDRLWVEEEILSDFPRWRRRITSALQRGGFGVIRLTEEMTLSIVRTELSPEEDLILVGEFGENRDGRRI